MLLLRASLPGAVIPDVVAEIQELLVNVNVADTSHKVDVLNFELGGQVGESADLERSCQVQESVTGLCHHVTSAKFRAQHFNAC